MNDMRTVEFQPEQRMRPDPTSARVRSDRESGEVDALALINAAECSTCAFYDITKTCRAWPPRPLADGRPVWPKVSSNDWCGCWRAM